MTKININKNRLPIALGSREFWRAMLALAIPIALQNMLSASFSLIDTLMVGQLGDIALSATGMAGQWSWLFGMALFGLSSGASVFVSQYFGDGNLKGIRRTVGISVSAGLVLSMIFLVTAALFPAQIVSIFNKNPQIITEGSSYLRLACISYPAMALTNILGAALRSVERPKLPMAVAGVCAVANVILNYFLIFPAGLGVKGAAIATAISSWLGPILLIAFSVHEKNILFAPLREFSFGVKHLRAFFRKATPVMLNETMWGLGTVAYNVIFANMGHEEYAAITIVKTFENIAFCFFMGLCNACCVMIGKSVGAGELRHAVRDSKRFWILMPVTSVIIGTAIILLRAPLVSIFNLGSNISAYTVATAKQLLIIYAAWTLIRNFAYLAVVGIFRPGGDTTASMIIEIFALWCFAVPITFLAANVFGLPFLTVYAIMYLAEDLPKVIVFWLYYRSGRWIRPVTEAGKQALTEFQT